MQQIVVLDVDGAPRLPAVSGEDFFHVAERLGASALDARMALLCSVHCDYGVFVKGEAPHRLVSYEDFGKHKINRSWPGELLNDKAKSLWWQRWGGLLLLATISEEFGMASIEIVDSYLGDARIGPDVIL